MLRISPDGLREFVLVSINSVIEQFLPGVRVVKIGLLFAIFVRVVCAQVERLCLESLFNNFRVNELVVFSASQREYGGRRR